MPREEKSVGAKDSDKKGARVRGRARLNRRVILSQERAAG